MEEPVVVIGVTGNVGSRIATKLANKGVVVRGVARDPTNFQGPESVELQAADLSKPEEAERVLKGARSLYLTPPEKGEEPFTAERRVAENVINAAKREGIAHIVLHTALQADRGDTGVKILDNKTEIERRVKESGVPYTILRPGWFMQNLFGAKPHIEQGTLSMPFPASRRIGSVSVEDVANAAVGFLEEGPQNRGFDLHVPGGVTCDALCQATSQARGQPVRFEEFAGEPRQFVEGYPISAKHKDGFAELFRYFREKDYLGKPEEVQQALPGFTYTTPEQFARSELFAPAAATRAPARR
jgi:uncharacterized protein YbjT (DUF2867 family)